MTDPTTAKALAEQFHEAYERLAPLFSYSTRIDTRTFDPLSVNGRLMIAVCEEILRAQGGATPVGEVTVEWYQGQERKVIFADHLPVGTKLYLHPERTLNVHLHPPAPSQAPAGGGEQGNSTFGHVGCAFCGKQYSLGHEPYCRLYSRLDRRVAAPPPVELDAERGAGLTRDDIDLMFIEIGRLCHTLPSEPLRQLRDMALAHLRAQDRYDEGWRACREAAAEVVDGIVAGMKAHMDPSGTINSGPDMFDTEIMYLEQTAKAIRALTTAPAGRGRG